MIVPTVAPSPLSELVDGIQGLHVMMLNTFRNPGAVVFDKLAKVDRISMDIAMLEWIAGLRVFIDRVPLDRIVFGSSMPDFLHRGESAEICGISCSRVAGERNTS